MQVFARLLLMMFATVMLLASPLAAAKAKPATPKNQTDTKLAPGNQKPAAETESGKTSPESSARPEIKDSLWQQALAAIEAGRSIEAKTLLRLCQRGKVQVPEAEKLLRGFLASDTVKITGGKPFTALSVSELEALLLLQNEICDFRTATGEDWRQLLDIAAVLPGGQQLIVAAQALLDRIAGGLPIKLDPDWVSRFKDLEKKMTAKTQVLYRLQIIEILATNPTTAAEYRAKLEDMRILARANAVRILGQADVAMAHGDLDLAKKLIGQVREFDRQYPGLDRAGQRLAKTSEIQRLIGLAGVAMRERTFLEAKRLCGEIQKIDANNAFARNMVQQIDEISSRGSIVKVDSAEARVALAVRRHEGELRLAEQDQDALRIRTALKDLLLLKADNSTWIARLAEIENQIAVSGFNAEESFKQAQALFKEGRYEELRLLLNRNPGLMNSVDTMIQAWEMRLMANYYTGRQEAAELRDSANAIIARAGQSFFASFVLMKLDIADNRIIDARVHYQNAVKINPAYPGLRWPGWLLWAQGEGRPAVVVVLIIVFFVLIQLLRPAFAFYESTYWFRVSLLARIFPSLALRSLEGCFGIYRDTSDRIKLFRLLVRCSNSIGDKKKVAMYAANLQELVPNDPLARSAGVAAPAAAGMQSQSVEQPAEYSGSADASTETPDNYASEPAEAKPVADYGESVRPVVTAISSGLGSKRKSSSVQPVDDYTPQATPDDNVRADDLAAQTFASHDLTSEEPVEVWPEAPVEPADDSSPGYLGGDRPEDASVADFAAAAADDDDEGPIFSDLQGSSDLIADENADSEDSADTQPEDSFYNDDEASDSESPRSSRLEDDDFDIPDCASETSATADSPSEEVFGDLFGNKPSNNTGESAEEDGPGEFVLDAADSVLPAGSDGALADLGFSNGGVGAVPEGSTDLPGFIDDFSNLESEVLADTDVVSGNAESDDIEAESAELLMPASAKLDYDEYESATLAGVISITEAENHEREAAPVDERMDYHEYESLVTGVVSEPDSTDRSVPAQQAEPVVFDLDQPADEADAISDQATVYNIEDSIKETRATLFVELDAHGQPGEISDAWRQILRKPVDSAAVFPELQ